MSFCGRWWWIVAVLSAAAALNCVVCQTCSALPPTSQYDLELDDGACANLVNLLLVANTGA